MKRTVRLSLTVLSLFIAHSCGLAQAKAKKIDELLMQYQAVGKFNGSALIAARGKVIYRKSFGSANFEWNIPNTPDTKFRIGSVTKSFTAVLIFQLVEQGKIRLDGKVIDYLPDFKKTGDRITVRQLLIHTSGLPDYNNVPDFFRAVQSGLLNRDEIIKRISEYDLLFEPGTKFGYSNDGYRVLGAIIEKVTGKPYEQVLRENILYPFGLKNSGYISRSAVLDKRASGYSKRLGGIENAPFYEASPASGMYSTVDDLYLWFQVLDDNKILAAGNRDLIWGLSLYGNAYGWLVSKTSLRRTEDSLKLMTEGAVFGFFARAVRLSKDKHTIILLTNVRAATNFLPDIERGITDILYDRAPQPPKRSIAEALLATIKQKGVNPALEQFRNLRSKQQNRYSFTEDELNNLGYFLLNNMRKVQDAIEMFKLNVTEYPQSSNAYDSLGQAYMVSGDKELAIENYQRSLELNPQNKNAIEMLKKLQPN